MCNLMGLSALLCSLAGCLAAQSLVVPPANTNNDGSGFSVWPYDTGSATYQVYLHRNHLTSLANGTSITGMSLRIMGGEPTYNQDLVYTEYGVVFSESDPASFSAHELASLTYATNQGANQTQVVGGPLTIPAGSLVGGGIPNPFSYNLQFTTPYIYTTGTDIVITIRHSAGGTGAPVRMDANNATTAVHALFGSGIADVNGQSGDVLIVKLLTPPTPDIAVERGSTAVADGSTDNVLSSYATTALPLTYTIRNTGTDTLLLTGATPVTFANEANCAVTVQQPGSTSIANGGSTTFVLTVTPAALGVWSVEVEIANNDPNESPYDFTVAGNAASGAEIEVRRGGVEIADNGLDTVTRKGTAAYDLTYIIRNLGNQDLALTAAGDAVAVSNIVNCTVTVAQPALLVIPPASETIFKLRIKPAGTGVHECTANIENNDADENPYNFAFQGNSKPEDEKKDDGSGCTAAGAGAWVRLAALVAAIVLIRSRRLRA